MAQNQVPPRPPQYQSTDAVCAAVALAYSSNFNRRGLESLWYAPYAHMFCDMATPYNGHILVHPQHFLDIPAPVVAKLKLQQEFDKAGLKYRDGGEKKGAKVKTNHRDDLPGADDGNRKSARVAEKRRDDAVAAIQLADDFKKDLLNRKNAADSDLTDFQNEYIDPDVSTQSKASLDESEAVDKEPDFVLSHVGKVKLRRPRKGVDTPEYTAHYTHRAGVKIFHLCCILVAEVKTPPARAEASSQRVVLAQLKHAQNDLLTYCSAHFERDRKADSVVALAAAGPFWRWAVVNRGDVPKLAWMSKLGVSQRPGNKVIDFYEKFSQPFTLGTASSDAELTRISRNNIYALVSNVAHTGQPPPS